MTSSISASVSPAMSPSGSAPLDFDRIGRVEAWLLRRRVLFTESTESHRVGGVERDMSRQMQLLTADEYEALSHLLLGKGFSLRMEDQTFPGIPRGGRVWMVVRRPDYDGPNVLTLTRAWTRIALTQAEPKAETVYWFTFLWFLTMSFFYDRSGRAVSEVSRYIEGNFQRGDLEDKAESHLEDLRRAGLGHEGGNTPVARVLLGMGDDEEGRGTTSVQIRKRVGRFLKVMVDTAMLDAMKDAAGEETYRQSLLCAVQIDELFAQDLTGFLPDAALAQGCATGEETRAETALSGALTEAVAGFVHTDVPDRDAPDREEAGDGPEDDDDGVD